MIENLCVTVYMMQELHLEAIYKISEITTDIHYNNVQEMRYFWLSVQSRARYDKLLYDYYNQLNKTVKIFFSWKND